jgi:hypothetical protein
LNQKLIFFSFLLLLFSLFGNGTQGQPRQRYRYEREIKTNDEERVNVISLKKDGLAIVRDLNKYNQGLKKWEIELVDTTLSSVWLTELELGNQLIFVGYEYVPNYLFLLFRHGETDVYNVELFTINLAEKLIQTNKIRFELNFKMTHFTMAGKNAIFGGYVSGQPAVLLYNQSSDQPKVLPGLFIKDVALLDLRTNQNQSFNVLLAEHKEKQKNSLVVRTYDQNGYLLIDDIIEFDSKYTILSGLTSALENEEMIILGTYGQANDKRSYGFFSVVVDPFSNQTVSYTDFSSLSHFLDYLPENRAAKTRDKANRQKTLSRTPDYKAYVFPIRIEEKPNGFYLLAEMYTQSSHFDPYPYAPYFYNPYAYGYYPYGVSPYSNRYYSPPNPYSNTIRHSSADMIQTMVIRFGPHGRAEKDVSMKLDDIQQNGPNQVGDFLIARDSLYLAYKKEGNLVCQAATADLEENATIRETKIMLKSALDILKNDNENEGGIRFWYNHHFYLWGFQTIRSNSKDGNQTRHVFYVNSVSLQ